jgi:hypothetical protein
VDGCGSLPLFADSPAANDPRPSLPPSCGRLLARSLSLSIMHACLSSIHRSLSIPRGSFISAFQVFVSHDAWGKRKDRVVMEIEQLPHIARPLPFPPPSLSSPLYTIRLLSSSSPMSSTPPLHSLTLHHHSPNPLHHLPPPLHSLRLLSRLPSCLSPLPHPLPLCLPPPQRSLSPPPPPLSSQPQRSPLLVLPTPLSLHAMSIPLPHLSRLLPLLVPPPLPAHLQPIAPATTGPRSRVTSTPSIVQRSLNPLQLLPLSPLFIPLLLPSPFLRH